MADTTEVDPDVEVPEWSPEWLPTLIDQTEDARGASVPGRLESDVYRTSSAV